MAQNTILLNNGNKIDKIEETIPQRKIESVSDGVVITYIFDKAISIEDPIYQEASILKINGFGLNDSIATPSILFRWDTFAIPANSNIAVSVIDSSFIDLPIELAPARPTVFESKHKGFNKDNVKPINPYTGFFPKAIISSYYLNKYRGQPLANICINPLQYNYETETTRIYKTIKYKITFTTDKTKNIVQTKRSISLDDNFIKNTVLNKDITSPLKEISSNSTDITKDYLIISVPKYTDAVNKFAEWKRTLGFRTHVSIRDTWSPETIKEEVKNIYDNNDALYYLLIVGGHNDVPAQHSEYKTPHCTDYYYGVMGEEKNALPDIYRGRLLVSTAEEATIVVNKIINYEKNPVLNKDFYTNGLHCGFFQDNNNDGYEDTRFIKTLEDIRWYMIDNYHLIDGSFVYEAYSSTNPQYWNNGKFSFGEPLPYYLKRNNYNWEGNIDEIYENFDYGALYVVYRGHGNIDRWGMPSFRNQEVNQLKNDNKLPVIFSITCLTGKFDDTTSCLAENFLKRNGGGGVAVFAATENSLSGNNDGLICGMLDAIWPTPGLIPEFRYPLPTPPTPTPEPTFQLGQILEQGLKRGEETWGMSLGDAIKYTREVYHCFGDPSMQIYTLLPKKFTNIELFKNANSITVNTNGDIANIAFYNKLTNNVTTYQGCSASYTGNTDNVIVCVSAHNKIPYIYDPTDILYIQNENIDGPKTYNANIIKVGSNITDTKQNGEVNFNSGKITLSGKYVELNGGTTINKGTELNIITK